MTEQSQKAQNIAKGHALGLAEQSVSPLPAGDDPVAARAIHGTASRCLGLYSTNLLACIENESRQAPTAAAYAKELHTSLIRHMTKWHEQLRSTVTNEQAKPDTGIGGLFVGRPVPDGDDPVAAGAVLQQAVWNGIAFGSELRSAIEEHQSAAPITAEHASQLRRAVVDALLGWLDNSSA
ncbi:hypothetical protein [Nocardia salmonicida]|uniref:hypothetical protein n=1 Tax=Nocardia salmonicida TaxID=53431 RepID=UPI003400CDCE